MHNSTELKSKSTEFIVKNSKPVMATKGWNEMIKASGVELVTELFRAFADLKK